ncbi:SpoIIIAH-like family protein [Camelliibacillus cellulosilyticus]|uniref:SpoIIIAH-like family protein n=1 Tax=Camelliibacillus cellulosilyticus TaxID=2174486 RepID=A0ABV9GLA3_9BACL
MVLKKQTVWLLTMLSLIVVLSVYYITSPGGSPSDQAGVGVHDNKSKEKDRSNAKKTSGDIATQAEETSKINEMKIERDDDRHKEYTKLENEIAQGKSVQAVSQAHDKLNELQDLATKEKSLETALISKGYPEATVVTKNGEANIFVKAASLSNKQANEIIQMAHKELGVDDIRVSYFS